MNRMLVNLEVPDDVAALKAGIRNPESETTIQREKYLTVKYMTWGKNYGIKKLK